MKSLEEKEYKLGVIYGLSYQSHLTPSAVLPGIENFTFETERIILEFGDKLSFVESPDAGSGNTNLSVTISYLEV